MGVLQSSSSLFNHETYGASQYSIGIDVGAARSGYSFCKLDGTTPGDVYRVSVNSLC
jgi:hypothetical protein